MATEPGWYPDPNDGNLGRYRDGTAWRTGEGAIRGGGPRNCRRDGGPGRQTRYPGCSALSRSAALRASRGGGLFRAVLALIIPVAGNAAAERAARNAGYFGGV
jgi:hypothetical protein